MSNQVEIPGSVFAELLIERAQLLTKYFREMLEPSATLKDFDHLTISSFSFFVTARPMLASDIPERDIAAVHNQMLGQLAALFPNLRPEFVIDFYKRQRSLWTAAFNDDVRVTNVAFVTEIVLDGFCANGALGSHHVGVVRQAMLGEIFRGSAEFKPARFGHWVGRTQGEVDGLSNFISQRYRLHWNGAEPGRAQLLELWRQVSDFMEGEYRTGSLR